MVVVHPRGQFLVDESGNPVGVIFDGSVFRLQVDASLLGGPVDVVDRAGRLLGHVDVDSSVLPVGAATEATLSTLFTEASFLARINTLGQKLMAGSTPVVIASDQSEIPVGVATMPLPAGAATEATLLTRATEATLLAVAALLTSIKDTDGIKKITDPVDVGDRAARLLGHVDVDSSALPVGAATEATLLTRATETTVAVISGILSSIKDTDGVKKITDPVDVSDRAARILGHVEVDSSALPVGAATEATLATRATEATALTVSSVLSSIKDTDGIKKITDPVDVSDRAARLLGHVDVDSSALPTGAATEVTLATRLSEAEFTARINTLGQKIMASSTPVVISSDQSTIPVSLAAAPLPPDAATETTLAAIKDTDGIKKITDPVDVSDRAARLLGHVDVDSSALPTGAATEATLATRATETTAATISATLTSIKDTDGIKKITDPVDVSDRAARLLGHVDVDSSALPTGAATEATLASIDGKIPASPAQEHVTAGSPHAVRLSDGAAFYKATTPADTQPISAASLPLPTGATTEATLSTRAAAAQLPGALVGGRLDTNLGAWLGSTAPTVGQKTMASSVPVAIASDQSTVVTADEHSDTAAVSSVAGSAVNVTLLAANSSRKGATIFNDSNKSLHVKCGATATLTSFTVRMAPEEYWEAPFDYDGQIDGIWDGTNGAARITEFT